MCDHGRKHIMTPKAPRQSSINLIRSSRHLAIVSLRAAGSMPGANGIASTSARRAMIAESAEARRCSSSPSFALPIRNNVLSEAETCRLQEDVLLYRGWKQSNVAVQKRKKFVCIIIKRVEGFAAETSSELFDDNLPWYLEDVSRIENHQANRMMRRKLKDFIGTLKVPVFFSFFAPVDYC